MRWNAGIQSGSAHWFSTAATAVGAKHSTNSAIATYTSRVTTVGRCPAARRRWSPHSDDSNAPQIVRTQLDFLVRVHELEQIVLITHFGCAVYAERLKKTPDECLPVQFQEAATAAATLRKWYPKLEVKSYLAMRRESCLSFHELNS